MVAGTSILKTIYYSIIGKLRFPKKYIGKTVRMEDGSNYKIFRHMKIKRKKTLSNGAIFFVRFKFKRSGHKSNMRKSKIPIPMIAGFPGFREKLWMVDYETDYWQGRYQFDDVNAIEEYKKSFVLGLMTKRADESTFSHKMIPDQNIEGYLESIISEHLAPRHSAQIDSHGSPTSGTRELSRSLK